MPDIFASAKRSLRRGQYHTNDLAERLNALNGPDALEKFATVVVDPQPNGSDDILKVRFHVMFRDEFPSVVFDAVSNFRACLDQIGYAIAVPRGLPADAYSPFPIAKDAKWIDNQINGLKYLPPEVRALFRSFNPYPGGNDALWALNELCNVKKHAALVPIDVRNIGVRGTIRGPIQILFPTFDAEANEVALAIVPRGTPPQQAAEISFSVVLDHPSKVVSGQHPIFLLEAMRVEVTKVLQQTEDVCRALGIV